jgi:hypothetical protein
VCRVKLYADALTERAAGLPDHVICDTPPPPLPPGKSNNTIEIIVCSLARLTFTIRRYTTTDSQSRRCTSGQSSIVVCCRTFDWSLLYRNIYNRFLHRNLFVTIWLCVGYVSSCNQTFCTCCRYSIKVWHSSTTQWHEKIAQTIIFFTQTQHGNTDTTQHLSTNARRRRVATRSIGTSLRPQSARAHNIARSHSLMLIFIL